MKFPLYLLQTCFVSLSLSGQHQLAIQLSFSKMTFPKDLAIGGRDLMALGMRPGREIGLMLNELLEWVIDEPSCNKKEILCEYVKEKLNL